MQSLYEKYRPVKYAEVIGQREAVKQIRTVLKRGWGGRAYWIAGDSGVGKSTLAQIIARLGADDFFIEEYDSPMELMRKETMKHIENSIQLYAPGKGGRAFIINEAHGLWAQEVRWLLGVLERLPNHVVFIFTTTGEAQSLFVDSKVDALPLLSRCIYIELRNNRYLSRSFALHCKRIARAENLDGQPLAEYIGLAKRCNNNCRMMLQDIEAGKMKGKGRKR